MSTNFRLSYNNGYEYIDLLPQTDIKLIKNIGNILSYSEIEFNVGKDDTEVILPQQLSNSQLNAPFYVELVSGKISDYNTISEIISNQNGFIIRRYGIQQKDTIKLKATFKEGGVKA